MVAVDDTPVYETAIIIVSVTLVLFVIPVCIVLRMFSARIYDAVIIHMTETWYQDVFLKIGKRLQNKSDNNQSYRLLDIGIGTATALIRRKEDVEALGIQVVGVDYDAGYVKAATQSIQENGLESQVEVHCCSIYEAKVVDEMITNKGKFDAAYFSGSFSLMPDPLKALQVAASYVKTGGRIYISQTFQKRSVPCLSCAKPLMKYVTTIDFGKLFFETELEDVLNEFCKGSNEYEIIENKKIPQSVDNRWQSAKSVVIQL